jgi:hypothetical protein
MRGSGVVADRIVIAHVVATPTARAIDSAFTTGCLFLGGTRHR